MAPGIGLIATVASTVYSYTPGLNVLGLHSAPLPSPAGSADGSTGAPSGYLGFTPGAQGSQIAGKAQVSEAEDEGERSSQGTARATSPYRIDGAREEGGAGAAEADDDDGAASASAEGRRASIESVEGVTVAARIAEDERPDSRAEEDDEHEDDECDGEDRVQLVQTPYYILVRNYTLAVPLLSLLAVTGVVFALTFGWPPTVHSPDNYPHRPLWRQLFFGLAIQSLSHSLRVPLFQLLSLIVPSHALATSHAAIHAVLIESLRFIGIILVVPRLQGDERWRWPDVWGQFDSFAGSVWFGLGWAVGEVAVGIWQGYRQLSYYKPVLPSREQSIALRGDEEIRLSNGYALNSTSDTELEDEDAEADDDEDDDEAERKSVRRLEEQVWELIAVQKREEVEELLGVPLPNIPSIISALWRLDSFFLALGLTLILSALHARHENDGKYLVPPHTLPLFVAIAVGHAAISVGWLVGIKSIGAPATTYASLLVALGAVVWGLLSWGALV